MKKTGYFYDERSFRLNVLRTTRNNGQDTLQDLNYYYDAVGNIVGEADHAQQIFYFANQEIEPENSYEYDALYRLIHATGRELTALQMPTHEDFVNNIPCPNTATNAMQNYTHHYQYDELGNMLQMSSQNQWTRDYIYDTATNRLLRHTQQLPNTYTYDPHGNMLTMPHLTSISWDYLDQLHSATNGTFSSYYNYDAEGNRTRKVIVKGNIREERYYIGGYEVFRKYINDTLDYERKTINISDDEKIFVRIEQKTGENPVIRYQYDNHLGSACLELDNIGQIISYEEYHPFGTTSYRSGRTETEVSLKRYKYCGKERDEETGLYYYGMRYYAVWICRFVSVDPLQFKYPELTPFQYASNRCITGIDLDGGEFVNVHENRMNEAQAKVNEAQANYNNLVNRHEGKITKSNIKKYKIESGLSQAQDKLRKETALFKEVDSYLYTLEITNKALYDKYNNLTDSIGEKIVINVELAGKSFDTRLGTVRGLRLGRLENEETGEIINYFATAKNQSLTIQLFSTSTNSENNTFPGDKTGHTYMTFANELGDIDYFFTNVKNPDSFKYFEDTTDPTSFGYTDINGAGEESEAFEQRRIDEVKTYINNHPELIKKYDPIKQSISR